MDPYLKGLHFITRNKTRVCIPIPSGWQGIEIVLANGDKYRLCTGEEGESLVIFADSGLVDVTIRDLPYSDGVQSVIAINGGRTA
jgi:hypothetical protein